MSEESEEPKSMLGAFFSGAKGGLISGGLMLGIYCLVGLAFGSVLGIGVILPGAIAATMLTTSIFSGIMGVKRNMTAHKEAKEAALKQTRTVAGPSQGVDYELDIADEAETPERSESWTNRTGRSEDRINKILADGPASGRYGDQVMADRATAASTANSIN